MTTTKLVVCESADGWSLHAPGSTDDEIATGDAPALVDGPWTDDEHVVPAAAYAEARRILAAIEDTTMTRYAMIDSHTGYIWGVEDAPSPVAACAQMDRSVDPSAAESRTYREIAASDSDDHYLVYDASGLSVEVTDGQDEAQIAAVEALPLVTRIAF